MTFMAEMLTENAPGRATEKRSVDMQIISDWVEPGSKVLDLGCGRGALLELLIRQKKVFGVGVDIDLEKIAGCLAKGVPAYHGDLFELMQQFPDQYFDRIICSRTLQEVEHPSETVLEALRLARNVTVGFVNHGFWKNRLFFLLHGRRIQNEVYPNPWHNSRTTHPVSVGEFEEFCRGHEIRIARHVYLAGNWKSRCLFLPKLRAGYALYDLERSGAKKERK